MTYLCTVQNCPTAQSTNHSASRRNEQDSVQKERRECSKIKFSYNIWDGMICAMISGKVILGLECFQRPEVFQSPRYILMRNVILIILF